MITQDAGSELQRNPTRSPQTTGTEKPRSPQTTAPDNPGRARHVRTQAVAVRACEYPATQEDKVNRLFLKAIVHGGGPLAVVALVYMIALVINHS